MHNRKRDTNIKGITDKTKTTSEMVYLTYNKKCLKHSYKNKC